MAIPTPACGRPLRIRTVARGGRALVIDPPVVVTPARGPGGLLVATDPVLNLCVYAETRVGLARAVGDFLLTAWDARGPDAAGFRGSVRAAKPRRRAAHQVEVRRCKGGRVTGVELYAPDGRLVFRLETTAEGHLRLVLTPDPDEPAGLVLRADAWLRKVRLTEVSDSSP